MKLNEVEIFKKIILFALEQSLLYIETKKEEYEKNEEIKEKSEHVYKENLTVLEEEILYLERTIDLVKEFNIQDAKTVEEFKEKLLSKIKEYYIHHGVPMICYAVVSEKVEASIKFLKEIFK
ncbi:MAG TPA: hypothetical protein PLE45_01075 [Spirochaetota bacterium]|nr:hypothetical protein [Spirochaetota bacterium]HOL56059.1 hypothetical protein [Spirochaetota bacterium]HPP03205.1 hypothetical protein [Spirochaetota bacterium]